jgi:hypothetical protein
VDEQEKCINELELFQKKFSKISKKCINVGNGDNINFWTDSWCGDPLVDQLGILLQSRQFISSKVSDFIVNVQWSIPSQLSHMFTNLSCIISQVSIPMEDTCNIPNFI